MASQLDNDGNIYDDDHLTELMTSMDTEVHESSAHSKKSKKKSSTESGQGHKTPSSSTSILNINSSGDQKTQEREYQDRARDYQSSTRDG